MKTPLFSPHASLPTSFALLLALAVCFSGCNRNWPKFWQEKNSTPDPIVATEFPIFAPTDFPPPIQLDGADPILPEEPVEPSAPIGTETVLPLVTPAPAEDTMEIDELQTVYFAYNSHEMAPETRELIRQNAEWILKNAPDRMINIGGHCDERGTEEYNMILSDKRAAAVRVELTRLGVNPALLGVIAYGESRPAPGGEGSNEEAWALNRRVQFLINY